MKKIIIIIVIVFTGLYGHSQDKREQIESARIAFISQRLNLSSSLAEKFWPLFNEYSNKRQELKRALKKIQLSSQEISTSEEIIKSNLFTSLQLKQKELDLEKEYLGRFLLILSARQISELQKAERDFLKTMLDKLTND